MSQLKDNTTSLQAILDTVNSLPDAGSGGAGMVNFAVVQNDSGSTVCYINADNQIVKTTSPGNYQAKGGIVIFNYVNQYTFSTPISVNGIDNGWEWMLAVVADGWELTLT